MSEHRVKDTVLRTTGRPSHRGCDTSWVRDMIFAPGCGGVKSRGKRPESCRGLNPSVSVFVELRHATPLRIRPRKLPLGEIPVFACKQCSYGLHRTKICARRPVQWGISRSLAALTVATRYVCAVPPTFSHLFSPATTRHQRAGTNSHWSEKKIADVLVRYAKVSSWSESSIDDPVRRESSASLRCW